ncbi:hypothetical protein ES702_02940 [subsurface metagenome]
MLENPGDELYFGEVYRQVLQEAWLPKGAVDWSRLGKSRRGWRPTQRGLYPNSPTEDQAVIRQCFSNCAAAWRALPWELPPSPFCDNRNDKKYWKDEKDRRGVMCSYYDLYMRNCLRFCLDTGCLPPANYLLSVQPELKGVECNKVYDLNFSNKCGDISFVSGVGEFISPNEWLSPTFSTSGYLCFKDANGSYGSTTFSFDPYISLIEYDPANPETIGPSGQVDLSVLEGSGPFTWLVSGTGFWFDAAYTLKEIHTPDRSATLYADHTACGAALLTITDNCGNVVTAYLRSTAGEWVIIHGFGVCGCDTGPPQETISGKYKEMWMGCSNACQGHCQKDYGSGFSKDCTVDCPSPYNVGLHYYHVYEWQCS